MHRLRFGGTATIWACALSLFACDAPGNEATTPATSTAALTRACVRGRELLVFVGSHDSGDEGSATGAIESLALDTQSGALRRLGSLPRDEQNQLDHPTFLAFDRPHKRLFAVSENYFDPTPFESAVASFGVDDNTGALTFLSVQHTGYAFDPFGFTLGAVHLTLDRGAKHVLVAIYDSADGAGAVQSYPVDQAGAIGPKTSQITVGPSAHQVTLLGGDKHLLVPSLGADAVEQLLFDPRSGVLSYATPPRVATPTGSGPRHLTLGDGERFAYLVSENSATIAVYGVHNGLLDATPVQTLSTLPASAEHAARVRAAEVQIDRSSHGLLYVSTRLDDETTPGTFSPRTGYVTGFRIDPRSGQLTMANSIAVGKEPRHFSIDGAGRFLVVANRYSDNVESYRIDPRTGQLTRTASLTLSHPAFAGIVDDD